MAGIAARPDWSLWCLLLYRCSAEPRVSRPWRFHGICVDGAPVMCWEPITCKHFISRPPQPGSGRRWDLCSSLLQVNNLRDIENDRKHGKWTMAALIGRKAAIRRAYNL